MLIVSTIVWYVYYYLDPRKPGKYTYQHISFLFQPMYIGKGNKYRVKAHLKSCFRSETSKRFYNALRKIQNLGLPPIYGTVKTFERERDAWDFEKQLIEEIGRKSQNTGPLLNHKDGGQPSQTDQSYRTDEWKYRISEKLKGHSVSDETREKIAVFNRGRKQSLATIQKRILKTTGKKRTQETKDAIGRANSGLNSWKAKLFQYQLIDPNGKVHQCAGKLNKFIKEHNLLYHPLRRTLITGQPVDRGKSKGWKMERL